MIYRLASDLFGEPKEFKRAGPLLANTYPDLVASKRKMRQVESIECVG